MSLVTLTTVAWIAASSGVLGPISKLLRLKRVSATYAVARVLVA
jgi:hypothetical protein